MITLDPAVAAALRVCLALLFGFAAFHKLRAFATFRGALADYGLLPGAWTPAAAGALIVSELALAATVPFSRLAAAAALSLLVLYTGAIAINLARGRRHIDCGCLGPAQRQSLSEWLVARNGLLIAGAALLLLPSAGRPLVWVDAVTVVASVGAFSALYAAANTLIASAPALALLRSPQ